MLKGIVDMMAPYLTTATRDAIEMSLRQNLQKPAWYAITAAHETTYRTVRLIYERIREIDVYGECITPDQRGKVQSLSLLIEERIAYLISKTPWIY